MEPETRYNMETEARYSVVENIKSEQIVRALTVMITFLSKIEEQSINKNKGSVNNINYGKLLDAELVVFRERFVADFCNYITQKYFDCLRNTSDFNLATFDNNEDKEQELLFDDQDKKEYRITVKERDGTSLDESLPIRRREQPLNLRVFSDLSVSKNQVDGNQNLRRQGEWYNANNANVYTIKKDNLLKNTVCPCVLKSSLSDQAPASGRLATYIYKFLIKLLEKYTLDMIMMDFLGFHANQLASKSSKSIADMSPLIDPMNLKSEILAQTSSTVLTPLESALVFLFNNFEIGDMERLEKNVATCESILKRFIAIE